MTSPPDTPPQVLENPHHMSQHINESRIRGGWIRGGGAGAGAGAGTGIGAAGADTNEDDADLIAIGNS